MTFIEQPTQHQQNIHFFNVREAVTEINPLGHKTNLNKFNTIDTVQSMFSVLESNRKSITEKQQENPLTVGN